MIWTVKTKHSGRKVLEQIGKRSIHIVCVTVFALCILLSTGLQKASASLNSCFANFSPATTTPGSDTSAVFGITNTSDTPINWIKITSPSGNYANISSASAYRWQADTNSSDATFSTGTMDPGAGLYFSVEFMAGPVTSTPAKWTIQVSDDPNGVNPISCDGDLSMNIEVQPSVINISNVTVADVSSSSITIKWDTDIPSTSRVSYGLDDSYGKTTALNSNLVTNHLIVLKNLQANTGYHYQVSSTTPADGGSASSGDSTFLTAIKEFIPPTVSTSASAESIVNLKVTDPGDKVPPAIKWTSALSQTVYQTIPSFSGEATDDSSVARVEYSVDGGHNWLMVDSVQGIGSKKANFSFSPKNLDDGNYQIQARVIDGGGNAVSTSVSSLVIDRLPPTIGGNLISVGPEVLLPDGSGKINTISGVDQKITLSATGGPTSINLVPRAEGNFKTTKESFALTKSDDNGLWSGIINFPDPGNYYLSAISLDGAGNRTERILAKYNVMPSPRVLSKDKAGHNSVIKGARLTLYYLDPDTGSWVVWDGAPSSQPNPQPIDTNGAYQYLLPGGTYYLKAEAKNYRTVITRRFTLDYPQALSTNIFMKKTSGLSLNFWPQLTDMQTKSSQQNSKGDISLTGKSMPQFNLPDLQNRNFNSLQLLGKPTVVTLLNTWSPSAQEQLAIIDKMKPNSEVQIIPIFIQDKQQKAAAYAKIAGYNFPALTDQDGQLADKLNIGSLPTHYFLDRKGSIIKVMVGVLNDKQLLDQILSLPEGPEAGL